MPGQPDSAPVSWPSQSSVSENRLCTTRTTQTPPFRVSTLNSVEIGGEPYFLSADGLLMPNKKGQRPPDLRYLSGGK